MSAKITETLKIAQKIITGDHTTATDAGWVDAKDFTTFAVATCASAMTGVGVTALVLEINTASDGSGTNQVLATHAVGSAPDAVGDMLILEADPELMKLANGRYVNAKVTAANAADDTVCTYILGGARYPQAGLSADVIAS